MGLKISCAEPVVYNRKIYYNKISPFINKPIIKIITGMRRIAKSTFLKLLINRFIEEGVSDEQIIFINRESLQLSHMIDFNDLYSEVIERYEKLKKKKLYLFIDEVQEKEIDFIGEKENRKAYIQVCYLPASDKTVEREFSVLLAIPDNYPKYVLSMDEMWGDDHKGVKSMNIIDFLLSEDDIF